MRRNSRSRLLQCLSKTWVVQRLKYIDLSVVPGWLGPCVSTASRYQHSLCVGRLSLLVSDGTEHDRLLLTAAAVLHDVGNGPFPHISDQFMEEILGFNHEGAIRFAFENSPSKDSSFLEEHGLNLDEVSSVVRGDARISSILNGQPDLDNADNVYRFMTSLPGKPLGEPRYHPTEIAACMSLRIGKAAISEDLRRRWLSDREKVYRYVWGDGLNMIGWTMLGRALRIMKEELTPRFFALNNREAFHLIRCRLPELAYGLRRNDFRIVLDREYCVLKGEARRLSDPKKIREVEDELCKETGLNEWAIGLTADQPFIKEKSDYWRIYLGVYKGIKRPKEILEDVLSSSVPLQKADFQKRKS